MDSVDITDLVEKSKSAFVDWAVAFIYGEEIALPGFQWVALPVINEIDKFLIRQIVQSLADSAVMGAFFLNTALKKATQAKDFVEAADALANVPTTATQEEYKRAEQTRMAAFRDFVLLTS